MSKMFNYEADQIHDMVHPDLLTDTTHYVAECKDIILTEATPNYPKLTDYESEWFYFYEHEYQGGGDPVNLEYQTLEFEQEAMIQNAIPFNYKSAILKGNTKYRDIDTGDILDTFDETKNLELVSVEMPVLTTHNNGNLFNKNTASRGYYSANGEIFNGDSSFVLSDYIEISDKMKLTSHSKKSTDDNFSYYCYDENKNFIKRLMARADIPVDLVENTKYVRISVRMTSGQTFENDYIDVITNIGVNATNPELYKSNILTVNEEVELRGIGDVKDELDLQTGKLTQRIGEVVLDGSENWSVQILTNNARGTLSGFPNSLNWAYSSISNNFLWSDVNVGDKSGQRFNGGNLMLSIPLKSLTSNDAKGFKEWLNDNNTIIQYKYSKESIKTVDLNTIIRPYEGTNHFYVSSDTIPPSCHLSVPVESTGAKTLNEISQED